MASEEYDFQKDLHDSIFDADPKLDRAELLVDIFKIYVAKLFELVISRRKLPKGRIPYDALVEVKSNLISEFRKTDLAEYQRSIEWYEELFDKTVQEILNDAALAHRGSNIIHAAPQQLEINPEAYINEGGLFLPKGMKS